MLIEKIHATLKRHGIVRSQYEFSENWLNKSRSYYSSIMSTNSEPSVEALATLKVRIENLRQFLCEKSQHPIYALLYEEAEAELEDAADALGKAIQQRCA